MATFDFDGEFFADGESLELVLTKVKFDNKDSVELGLRIMLSASVLGGGTVDTLLESLVDTSILTTDADGNITVHFDALFGATAGLNAGDNLESFSISALDDDVELGNLKETAEHFLINSLSGNFVPIPEPSTLLLTLLGLTGLTLWGKPRA